MKALDLQTGLVARLVFINKLYVENSRKLSKIMTLFTVTLGTATGLHCTMVMVVDIKQIMGMRYFVLGTLEVNNKQWYVNNRIDLEIFNRIY